MSVEACVVAQVLDDPVVHVEERGGLGPLEREGPESKLLLKPEIPPVPDLGVGWQAVPLVHDDVPLPIVIRLVPP
eukprot:CAMPEP_0173456584 /NCGR_PEP_ID=MMETSP1357-20121228/56294_1 /TAXON_ID=77926 /ORGANISM="Hemiselmis rufescens, Strain PCC563" /LENGTH=74 /DNA_ID=CAMNT_0014423825 /DNA_START=359 /DNA_END=580 /DNA_ORIENTATION=-